MKRDTDRTKVVFRWFRNYGECIALFPQIAGCNQGWTCSSYMHVGQHSAADLQTVVAQTRLATPKEYRPLAKELRNREYRLDIQKRCTRYDLLIRIEDAKI